MRFESMIPSDSGNQNGQRKNSAVWIGDFECASEILLGFARTLVLDTRVKKTDPKARRCSSSASFRAGNFVAERDSRRDKEVVRSGRRSGLNQIKSGSRTLEFSR